MYRGIHKGGERAWCVEMTSGGRCSRPARPGFRSRFRQGNGSDASKCQPGQAETGHCPKASGRNPSVSRLETRSSKARNSQFQGLKPEVSRPETKTRVSGRSWQGIGPDGGKRKGASASMTNIRRICRRRSGVPCKKTAVHVRSGLSWRLCLLTSILYFSRRNENSLPKSSAIR